MGQSSTKCGLCIKNRMNCVLETDSEHYSCQGSTINEGAKIASSSGNNVKVDEVKVLENLVNDSILVMACMLSMFFYHKLHT